MKILYSAPSLNLKNEWCELIARRLAVMHECVSFDYRRMPSACNDALKNAAQELKPDMFFVIKGELIDPGTVKYIRSLGAKCVLFDNDDFQLWKPGLYREFDHVFTPCKDLLPEYDNIGVSASQLFYPYSPRVHRKLYLQKKYDIVYVGTYYPERENIVKAFHRLGMPVYGDGWEKVGIRTSRMSAAQWIPLYNESRIVLNIHQSEMKKHHVGFNLRIGEALGCGAFVLTDYCTGMETVFRDKVHLAIYDEKDLQDLFIKVRYYLSNEDERQRIANAGHERVQEFSIDNFLHEVLTC